MNSSFSDELGCITDATDEEQNDLPYDGDVGITCKYNNNSDNLNDCTCTKDTSGILNLACSEVNKNIKATANYETHSQPEEFSSHHRDAIGTTGISAETPGSEASFKKELPVSSFSKSDSKEHLTHSKMSNVLLRHFSQGELTSTCQLIECETIPETSFTESIDDTVNKPKRSEHDKGPLAHEQRATNFEEYHLEKHKEINTELKYGQGQAHYCLPDSSEVASEVKVPKRSDNINSVPTTERAKSFPVLLSKSVIVNNILENKNYFNSAEVENQEEMRIPELLQQPEILRQSDFPNASIAIYSGDTGTSSEVFTLHASIPTQSRCGLSKARLQCGTTASALPAAGTVEAHCLNPSDLLPQLTLGEKMSQVLKDQTDQLIKKVEDFTKRMTQETFLLQDNHLALNQLKRHLKALERNYLTAREEHRNLELQNYKDKSINIGKFDPERKVEGEIFRLGMLLEDIQEQTDDSKCNSSSLLTSCESAHSSYSLCEIIDTGSDSEDISAYDSYNDSQSEALVNCETENYKTFNTRLCGEKKGKTLRLPKPAIQAHMIKLPFHINTYPARSLPEADLQSTSETEMPVIPMQIINKAIFYSQQILSSTLDHAIQIANSLKKATERMVRAVSEDLAKVKRKQL
ncbi:PREDICTED: protein AKNAD1 [Fulmarus glacialis]|uniref:protein AKNAD1 n=1 Tax=Fulmarus glacialis TaxID=30455 RepID=UPI00051BF7BC|nr:PREDICTED: protein AKNAD1 [Fulmarus glacialis]